MPSTSKSQLSRTSQAGSLLAQARCDTVTVGLTHWQPLEARVTLLVLILAPNAQFGTRGAEGTTNRRELEDQRMIEKSPPLVLRGQPQIVFLFVWSLIQNRESPENRESPDSGPVS
jgi:hypothetical protein